MSGDGETEVSRRVTARAIRRLGVLEWVVVVGAAGLALVAGALIAFLLSVSLGFPFRWTWAGASLVVFVVPAGLIGWRDRREADTPPKGGGDG